MYTLQFCDYDEEKQQQQKEQQKTYATGFLPRCALYEGIPRNQRFSSPASTPPTEAANKKLRK